MNLERFQVDDLLHIKPRKGVSYPGFLNAMQAEHGMALTLWNANDAVGAAGVTRWKLCDEAWCYLSDWLVARPIVLRRLVVQHLPFFCRVLRTRDLIARVQPEHAAYRRWPESLGMEFAGIDEEGYWQYRRTF